MDQQQGNTNLTAILRTLSAYAPSQNQPHSAPPELEEGEYDPAEYDPSQYQPPLPKTQSQSQSQSTSTTQHPTNEIKTNSTELKSAAKPPAASVKTWPKALNHTIRYICSDPRKLQRIQHLIDTQHSHETQWWKTREELIRVAQNRDASRMRLDSVLSSIGGIVKKSKSSSNEDEIAKELSIFDRKVHKACQQMNEAAIKELRDLEIPFFCKGYGDTAEEREQMGGLRSKMVGFLEAYLKGDEET